MGWGGEYQGVSDAAGASPAPWFVLLLMAKTPFLSPSSPPGTCAGRRKSCLLLSCSPTPSHPWPGHGQAHRARVPGSPPPPQEPLGTGAVVGLPRAGGGEAWLGEAASLGAEEPVCRLGTRGPVGGTRRLTSSGPRWHCWSQGAFAPGLVVGSGWSLSERGGPETFQKRRSCSLVHERCPQRGRITQGLGCRVEQRGRDQVSGRPSQSSLPSWPAPGGFSQTRDSVPQVAGARRHPGRGRCPAAGGGWQRSERQRGAQGETFSSMGASQPASPRHCHGGGDRAPWGRPAGSVCVLTWALGAPSHLGGCPPSIRTCLLRSHCGSAVTRLACLSM